jgi:hypothetical protein
MRRSFQLWLGAFGLLLVSAALWISKSYPLHREDVSIAFARLAEVPLNQVEGQGSVDLTLSTPNNAAWTRIRDSWGDPGYIVAAVSPGSRRDMYCLQKLDLNIRVTIGAHEVSLGTAEYPPYGYSADCKPVGVQFRAPAGAMVRIQVAGQRGRFNCPADLIIEPYWTVGTKDHLVGAALEQQFHLRTVASFLALAGGATLVGALWLFVRRRMRSV